MLHNISHLACIGQPFIDRLGKFKPGFSLLDLDISKISCVADLKAFFEIQKTNFEQVSESFGDLNFNASRNLALAGRDVTYIGMIGKDTEERWHEPLIPSLHFKMKVAHEGDTGMVGCLRDSQGKEEMLALREVNTKLTFAAFQEEFEQLPSAHTGVLMSGFVVLYEDKFIDKALDYFKEHHIPIYFTLGRTFLIQDHREALLSLLPHMQHICCNLEEARCLFQDPELSCEEAIKEFQKKVYDAVIVITDGPNGAWGGHHNAIEYAKAHTMKKSVINTFGAGDAHRAFFLHAYAVLEGQPQQLKRALEYANFAATKVLRTFEAQFPVKKWTKLSKVQP